MKPILKIAGLSFVAMALLTAKVDAQTTLVDWNFNSTTPDNNTATGTTSPLSGTGTISLIGGVTSTFATGSPGDLNTPTNDNSGLNLTGWATQGTGSGTAGLQVATSTLGYDDLTISLDFRQSGTVSRDFQLQVSSDGTHFSNVSGGTASFGIVGSGNTLTSFSSSGFYVNNPGGGSQSFVQDISYTLALGGAYENDPNFAFRWVAVFDPSAGGTNYIAANAGTIAGYSTSGTGRFDDVSVTGSPVPVPEPGVVALGSLGVTALVVLTRRQRKI